jgi:hypothetical protein
MALIIHLAGLHPAGQVIITHLVVEVSVEEVSVEVEPVVDSNIKQYY